MISTIDPITDAATDRESDQSEFESSGKETDEGSDNVGESLLASPFSNDATQLTEITEDL